MVKKFEIIAIDTKNQNEFHELKILNTKSYFAHFNYYIDSYYY